MAPSIIMGAVILLCRKAPANVMFFHSPSGTLPINRAPRGARPLSRTMLVVTAVSSINTSRAGSSIPCSRIQRRRARATSARCRSAACRLFFEGDVVTAEKSRQRTLARSDASSAQLSDRLHQRQVRIFRNHSHYQRGALLQWRNASSARLRRGTSALAPTLQPFDCRTHAHLETIGRLVSRRSHLYSLDHAFPQVRRIGLRHRPPPKRRINAQRLAHLSPVGNPADSKPAGTALVWRFRSPHHSCS